MVNYTHLDFGLQCETHNTILIWEYFLRLSNNLSVIYYSNLYNFHNKWFTWFEIQSAHYFGPQKNYIEFHSWCCWQYTHLSPITLLLQLLLVTWVPYTGYESVGKCPAVRNISCGWTNQLSRLYQVFEIIFTRPMYILLNTVRILDRRIIY